MGNLLSQERLSKSSLLLVVAACVAATAAAWMVVNRPLIGIDDSNIFFAYAKNIAAGNGYVYYAGGERVEGFTSFLWVLVCAASCLASPSAPEPLLLGINVFLLCLTLIGCYRLALMLCIEQRKGHESEIGSDERFMILCFCGLGLLTCPKFVIWLTITLMDTGAWATIFTWGTLFFVQPLNKHSDSQRLLTRRVLCIVLMVLIRPEGMLIGVLWITTTVLFGTDERRPAVKDILNRVLTKTTLVPAIAFVATLGLLVTFRLIYFGYPLPNTYYAKVSPSPLYNLRLGLGYTKGYFSSQPLALIAVGVACFNGYRWFTQNVVRTTTYRTSFIFLAILSIPIIAGGDHFAYYRFYQPAWSLMIALITVFIFRTGVQRLGKPKRVALAGMFGIACLILQSPNWHEVDSQIRVEFDYARSGRAIGSYLNEAFGENRASIGVTAAGGVAFAYRGAVIDLMGLNNVKMGHSPGDRRGNKNHAAFHIETFYELQPEFVLPSLVREKDRPISIEKVRPPKDGFWDSALHGLTYTDRFQQVYVPVVVQKPTSPSSDIVGIKGWFRKDAIASFQEAGVTIIPVPD